MHGGCAVAPPAGRARPRSSALRSAGLATALAAEGSRQAGHGWLAESGGSLEQRPHHGVEDHTDHATADHRLVVDGVPALVAGLRGAVVPKAEDQVDDPDNQQDRSHRRARDVQRETHAPYALTTESWSGRWLKPPKTQHTMDVAMI